MSEDTKKLHRSKDDRWVAGVCGGIAEYFNIDSTLVRVIFILFGFAVGGGILIYIILWLIMPAAKSDDLDTADENLNQVEVEEAGSEEQAAGEEVSPSEGDVDSEAPADEE